MKPIILPIVLVIVGVALGAGAGFALRPEAVADLAADAEPAGAEPPAGESGSEFVKLNGQFVVPVVADARVGALVIISLSIEVPTAGGGVVYEREPKLRDALLRAMFEHANLGGFQGGFTEVSKLAPLRRALTEAAQGVLGKDRVINVLITDIVRQDG